MKVVLFIILSFVVYSNIIAQTKSTTCFNEEEDSVHKVFNGTLLIRKDIFWEDGAKKGTIFYDDLGTKTKVICYYRNGKLKETVRWKVKLLSWSVQTIRIMYDEKGRKKRIITKERAPFPSM